MPINRRQTLQFLVVGSATVAGALGARAQDAAVFRHGVASGDPDASSVVLWTRVTTDADILPVGWELASDAGFTSVVASGEATAARAADHSVKVVPEGLEPGASYFYRFTAGGETSPVGRTRTLPSGALDTLGIALASCSNFTFGYFNAYDAIARDAEVDIVLHTGDYIYEYGADGWGGASGAALGRAHDPAHEMVSLEDYRRRHAQYKTDAGAQAMHAAHPMVACWDDHEVTNNPWTDGAGNHQPETEGEWGPRRDTALQAYYEWMPVRDPASGADPREFWRTYVFGDLATLITLETRHTGRGEQVSYPEEAAITSREERDRFMREVMEDPSRMMLSPGMEAHLRAGLSASVAAGQPWRVIGNASPMARMLLPDFTAFGLAPEDFPEDAQAWLWRGRHNLPWYTDTWDGYPVAREAFYALAREAGAADLLVLTGDSHNFWANTLMDGEGRPVGVEVGTAGISSPSDLIDAGFGPEMLPRVDKALVDGMDEVRWADSTLPGYVRVVIGRDAAVATFIGVDTVLSPEYRVVVVREERIAPSGGSLAFQDG